MFLDGGSRENDTEFFRKYPLYSVFNNAAAQSSNGDTSVVAIPSD